MACLNVDLATRTNWFIRGAPEFAMSISVTNVFIVCVESVLNR